jgi:hypothetical protein
MKMFCEHRGVKVGGEEVSGRLKIFGLRLLQLFNSSFDVKTSLKPYSGVTNYLCFKNQGWKFPLFPYLIVP